jgi:hypothetical protein
MRRPTLTLAALVSALCAAIAVGQTKNFTPVEGANLKAKIDAAIVAGRAGAASSLGGRFWVAYQFEVRPGVAMDFEIVDGNGGVYISTDGVPRIFDARHETRELGLFLLFDTQRENFTRAEVYNLQRQHEFSGYPVYWAGRVSNEESLNYLKSIVDSSDPELKRLGERAAFAIALHDDARVDAMLTEMIRKPVSDQMRSRAILLARQHWRKRGEEHALRRDHSQQPGRHGRAAQCDVGTRHESFPGDVAAATEPLRNDDDARSETSRAQRHRPQRQRRRRSHVPHSRSGK